MPRAPPFTQRKIAERAKFGFGPKPAEREGGRGKIEKPKSCPWNFNSAIDILARQKGSKIKTGEARDGAHDQIAFICRLYELDRAVELQETDAAKAAAFQLASRWYKSRLRALAQIQKAIEIGDEARARDGLAKLHRLPWIAPALEQEAARLQQAKDLTVTESFNALKVRHARASGPGRIASDALICVVQRLQVLASEYAPKLTWTGRNVPPELKSFILEVLDAAGIKYPRSEENPTRFRRLLIRPGGVRGRRKPVPIAT